MNEELGRAALENGLLSESDLQRAREEARDRGEGLAEVLVSGGFLSPSELASLWEHVPDPASARESTSREGGPAAASPAPAAGDSRYVLVREIGRGGMGVVHEAEDRELGRRVALKRIPAAASSPRARERFLAEAQVTAQLSHPNIVPLHDVGSFPDGDLYVTMKLIEGETLRDALVRHRERPARAGRDRLLRVLVDVTRALEHAHARGVVHRDLKPENVMIGPYGETVVMDWGLAKLVEGGRREPPGGPSDRPASRRSSGVVVPASHRTADGLVVGTCSYMSPEQVEGDPSRIDVATDVWALGVVLYEIVTGSLPFRGKTQASVLRSILDDEPRAPDRIARGVPPELSAIAMKCLARRTSRRYASAADLGRDLELFLEGKSVGAYEDPLVRRIVKFARRNPFVTGTAGLLAAVVAIAGVWLARAYAEVSRGRDEARRNLEGRVEAEAREEAVQRALKETSEVARWAAHRGMAEEAPVRARFQDVIDRLADRGFVWRARGIWYYDHRYEGTGAAALTTVEVLDRAEADLRRALERDPEDFVSMMYLFLVAKDRGELARALEWCDRIVEASPENEFRWFARAHRISDEAAHEPRPAQRRALAARALEAYDRALAMNPDFEWALHDRGVTRTWIGRHDDALADFDRVLELRPDYARALENRGSCWFELGRPDRAMDDFRRATEIDPASAGAWRNLGVALYRTGRIEDSIEAYDRALAGEPDAAGTLCHRGIALMALGRTREALADLERAVELAPDDVMTRRNRGTARLRTGDPAGAILDFSRALDLDPDDLDLRLDRARARFDAGDVEGAFADLDRAAELAPASARPVVQRAALTSSLGRLEDAVALYGRALELDPGDVEAHYGRGLALYKLGRGDAARADVLKALALDERHARARFLLALTKGDDGDVDGMRRELDRSLALDPDQVDARHARGEILARAGDLEAGLADLDRAVELDPSRIDIEFARGMILTNLGRPGPAILAFDRVLAAHPDQVDALVQRGLLHVVSKRPGKALPDLRRALELRPDHPDAEKLRRLIDYYTKEE